MLTLNPTFQVSSKLVIENKLAFSIASLPEMVHFPDLCLSDWVFFFAIFVCFDNHLIDRPRHNSVLIIEKNLGVSLHMQWIQLRVLALTYLRRENKLRCTATHDKDIKSCECPGVAMYSISMIRSCLKALLSWSY